MVLRSHQVRCTNLSPHVSIVKYSEYYHLSFLVCGYYSTRLLLVRLVVDVLVVGVEVHAHARYAYSTPFNVNLYYIDFCFQCSLIRIPFLVFSGTGILHFIRNILIYHPILRATTYSTTLFLADSIISEMPAVARCFVFDHASNHLSNVVLYVYTGMIVMITRRSAASYFERNCANRKRFDTVRYLRRTRSGTTDVLRVSCIHDLFSPRFACQRPIKEQIVLTSRFGSAQSCQAY